MAGQLNGVSLPISTATSVDWSYIPRPDISVLTDEQFRLPALPLDARVMESMADDRNADTADITTPLEEILESDRYSRHLQLHEDSDRWLVVLTDRRSGRVAYTIPPESLLDMLGRIRQYVGVLLDARV